MNDTEDRLAISSTGTIRRAAALLDAVFAELVDPMRWCKDAYVCDAAGELIEGPLLAAIESPAASSRCLFSSLLHQGLARGFRIEIETAPDDERSASEVTRAPASWMLAGLAVASVAFETLRTHGLLGPGTGEEPGKLRLGEFIVGTTVVVNDGTSYEDVIWTVALAAELLRAELDRRAEAGR